MAMQFDRETIERLRALTPREAFEEARRAVFQAGGTGSEDFLDAYDQLVEAGLFTWDDVEAFDAS